MLLYMLIQRIPYMLMAMQEPKCLLYYHRNLLWCQTVVTAVNGTWIGSSDWFQLIRLQSGKNNMSMEKSVVNLLCEVCVLICWRQTGGMGNGDISGAWSTKYHNNWCRSLWRMYWTSRLWNIYVVCPLKKFLNKMKGQTWENRLVLPNVSFVFLAHPIVNLNTAGGKCLNV